jgi:small redox-active disulfide protein 2
MKKLQILGTGCANCEKLTANTVAAAESLNIQYEVEKVTNIGDIMKFGVMATPALAVDGEVKIVGKVASVEEIQKVLG